MTKIIRNDDIMLFLIFNYGFVWLLHHEIHVELLFTISINGKVIGYVQFHKSSDKNVKYEIML